jgi:hypothetical protein
MRVWLNARPKLQDDSRLFQSGICTRREVVAVINAMTAVKLPVPLGRVSIGRIVVEATAGHWS